MKYKMGLSDSNPNRKRVSSSGRIARSPHRAVSIRGNHLSPNAGSKNKSGLRKVSRITSRFSIFSKGGRSNSGKPSGPRTRKAQFKRALGRAVVIISGVGFIGTIVMMIVLGLYLKSLQGSLPDPDRLIEWSSDQSTIIYDRNGKELFKIYGNENREFVPIDDYPEHTKWALLAAEDGDFYQHKGLDWKGIIGCGIVTTRSYFSSDGSGQVCGASTITQQLVRNTIMYEVYGDEAFERSTFWKAARRKLRELLLSMQVERSLSKDEILQLYMNEIALGGVNYGYGAASKDYFGKEVKDLTLAESALLAGLVQSPSVYSPLYGDPELAKERQQYVFGELEDIQERSGIPQEEIDAARAEELIYESARIDIEAYHWVFYVKQILEEKYGPEVVQKGGLKVTTTLDFSTQTIAEEEIINGVATYVHKFGGMNGGLVAVDPHTGQILAMVGSVDPNEREDPRIDGSVNVTTSLQQTGSSFKPYVYFEAMRQYGPWLEAADMEYNFGSYRPQNWDGFKYYGNMTAREALVLSRNLPAIYSLQTVGIGSVVDNLEKSGVTTLTNPDNYGLSMAIGSAEMKLTEHVQAYSVFASGGVKHDLVSILKIEDSKGKILEEWKPSDGERVFDEKDVYLLNWTLCDLGGFGDQVGASLGFYNVNGVRAACGKTGTTDGPVDLVDVLYHKNLVVGVWLGNNNNVPMPGAWSTDTALPLAHNFMQRVASKYPPESYSRPSGIVEAMVCEDTGRLATEETDCNKVKSIYVQGRAPKNDERSSIKVCKDRNVIPTNESQAEALGLLTSKILLNFTLENPNQQEVFERYMLDMENSQYLFAEPEHGRCELPLGPGGSPVVDLVSPTSGTAFNVGDTISISGSVRVENGVESVQILFDDEEIYTGETIDFQYDYLIPSGTSAGSHVITVNVIDLDNREGTSVVTITVNIDPSNSSVTITNPGNGQDIATLPISLVAVVEGVVADRVTFQVLKPSDPSYVRSYTDLDGANGWGAQWIDPTATSGEYTIQAFAIVDGLSVIESEVVTITLN